MAVHALRHAPRMRHAVFEFTQDAARGLQECRARRRQGHAAIGALEQLRANFGFKPSNGLAERRLRHVQALRRAIEMQGFRHGDKLPQ
ncbi:hypothetical protein D3C71_1439260 [compost metagenome]